VSAGGVAPAIVIERLAVAVSAEESVTFAVKGKFPAAVGVPEIEPADESARPPGKAPEETVQE
jgi:hypothetical protein